MSSRFLAPVVFVFAAAAAAHGQTVTFSPIKANIQNKGKVQLLPFGEIAVKTLRDPKRPERGASIHAKFSFRAFPPAFLTHNTLDDWHDFRWVNRDGARIGPVEPARVPEEPLRVRPRSARCSTCGSCAPARWS